LEQISHTKDPLLVGAWDWNIYAGYEFLYSYPSAIYYIWALISMATEYKPEVVVKAWVTFSFIATSVVMYLVVRRITKNTISAFAIALMYVFTPYIPYYLLKLGYAHTAIIFAIVPLYIYYTLLKNTCTKRDIAISAGLLTLVAVIHIMWAIPQAFMWIVKGFHDLVFRRNPKMFAWQITIVVLSVSASAFVWFVPIITLLHNNAMNVPYNDRDFVGFWLNNYLSLIVATYAMPLAAMVLVLRKRKNVNVLLHPKYFVFLIFFVLWLLPHRVGSLYLNPLGD